MQRKEQNDTDTSLLYPCMNSRAARYVREKSDYFDRYMILFLTYIVPCSSHTGLYNVTKMKTKQEQESKTQFEEKKKHVHD